MVKSPQKLTVAVTPGQNAPVNHVIKFEDLVQKMQQGAAKQARTRAAVAAKNRAQLSAIQQLAADLERQLRDLRAAMPDQPNPPPASRVSRSKGKS